MANTRYLIGAMGLAAILAVMPGVNAGGYYRWTDDQGQTHYSQNPPPNQPAEFIRTSTGTGTGTSAAETGSRPPSADPTPESAESAVDSSEELLQGLPEKDPALCQQAREVIQSLDGYARIRARQPDGSYRVLSEADKAEQRQRAEDAIEIHCD